jgi:hypothetical protein
MGNPQECAKSADLSSAWFGLCFSAQGEGEDRAPGVAAGFLGIAFGGLRALAAHNQCTPSIGFDVMQSLIKTIPARLETFSTRWRAIWALVRWEFC